MTQICIPKTLQHQLDYELTADFILHTKPSRLALGRSLYRYQSAETGQMFWLKTQNHVADIHSKVLISGFMQELDVYAQCDQQQCSFILPFFHYHSLQGQTWLGVEHAAALFQQAASALTRQQFIHVLWQIFDAVGALHRMGWLHGDLKAEHFLYADGQVKLIDFEHCQAIAQCETHQNLALQATPRYMAPELFQGHAKSPQSDLYAIGIILLEWINNERFAARGYVDWALLHCQQLTLDLDTEFKWLEPLFIGLLAKHKSRRFLHVDQVKRCLMAEIE